ncbi:hypothetical protein KP509_07G073300 [Ceratopteris richardii]|uniref:Cupin type-2 domain-containing protein n=1 Tax=Ceratopteris richardii TaxID=49495 RepID=A0A8T2UB66_CERRI|nr:hypothetical protein KP509_07G073300 [Ceratopteris richardii]
MDQISISANQFHAVSTPTVDIVRAGEGISVWALGVLVTLKALGNETGGSYSLFEDIVPPGIGPPLHIHTQEDETWYMLDGELIWKVGNQEFTATKGSFIHLPRFVPHAFENKSGKPAHMVLTYAPAGFEKWFLDIGKPVVDPEGPSPELTKEDLVQAVKLGKEYGLIFVGSNGHSPDYPSE